MKKLYLIRHAKSDWGNANHRDFDRPLNERGKKNAAMMGAILKNNGIKPDMILSSPAVRARNTALAIAQAIDYPIEKIFYNDQIYETNSFTILSILRTVDSSIQTLFLIGHNPILTEIANMLSNHQIINLPTAGIFGIEFSIKKWNEIKEKMGNFIYYDYPKKHTDNE